MLHERLDIVEIIHAIDKLRQTVDEIKRGRVQEGSRKDKSEREHQDLIEGLVWSYL